MRRFVGFERGVNLGGWLSQFDEYSEEHFNTYITEEDIKTIASWGLDHVRIPVDYSVIETDDGTPIESGYNHLDRCLSWCRKYGLHMIIDIHAAPGYNFDPLVKSDKEIFFHDKSMQEHYYKFWKNISKHFGNDYEYVAYELLNEIVPYSVVNEWNDIALKTIAAIREDSPKSWIVFGGVCYNAVSSVAGLADAHDEKVVHTFHCYEPMIFTHQGAYWVDGMPEDFRTNYPVSMEDIDKMLQELPSELANAIDREYFKITGPEFFEKAFAEAIKASDERNIPLYCGEYGVIDKADMPNTMNWIKDISEVFNRHGIARSYWNYKGKDYEICGNRCKDYLDELTKLF